MLHFCLSRVLEMNFLPIPARFLWVLSSYFSPQSLFLAHIEQLHKGKGKEVYLFA